MIDELLAAGRATRSRCCCSITTGQKLSNVSAAAGPSFHEVVPGARPRGRRLSTTTAGSTCSWATTAGARLLLRNRAGADGALGQLAGAKFAVSRRDQRRGSPGRLGGVQRSRLRNAGGSYHHYRTTRAIDRLLLRPRRLTTGDPVAAAKNRAGAWSGSKTDVPRVAALPAPESKARHRRLAPLRVRRLRYAALPSPSLSLRAGRPGLQPRGMSD